MPKLTLKLLATGYRQPNEVGNDAAGFTQRTSGEVFDANDQAEYDRLIEIGAAQDPQKAQQAERDRLADERARLEAQQAELDSQIAQLQPPEDLKGDALNSALSERGLSTEGKLADKQARLAEALAAES